MERKRPFNKDKDMSILYGKLGMVPEKLDEQESSSLLEGYHYQKIQRNLYRYQQGLDYGKLAQDSFFRSAEQGEAEGMYQYGLCCLEERTSEKEREGLDYLFKASDLNHTESMYHLGEYYRTQHQYSTAYGWYQKAANLDHPEALFFQGFLPIYCANLPFQLEESLELFQKARDKASIEVLFYDLESFKQQGQVENQRKTQEILLETLFQKIEEHPAVHFYRLGMGYLNDLFLGDAPVEILPQEAEETEEDFAKRQNQQRLKPLIAQGLIYLKESAGLNYHKAQQELSEHYFKVRRPFSYIYQPDFEEGRKWLSFAMKNKSPDSFAYFSFICDNGVLEIKTEEEMEQLDQMSQNLGSKLANIRRIENKAKANPQEKERIYQEGIVDFFKEQRPILHWKDFLTTMPHINDRVVFLEEVQKRLPYLPSMNRNYHKVPFYATLLTHYLEQGDTEKAGGLMNLEFQKNTVLFVHSFYFRTKYPPHDEYSFNLVKGSYYEMMGENNRAIACYEDFTRKGNPYLLSAKERLKRLYELTENAQKQLEDASIFVYNEFSPEVWNRIYPLLLAEPEKKQGDKTYADLFKKFELALLPRMDEFSYYFREKLSKLSPQEEVEYILSSLRHWQLKEEGVRFFVHALEDYESRTGCPCVLLHLACIFHPHLPYSISGTRLNPVKNREKSLFYWKKLLELEEYDAQEVFGEEGYLMGKAVGVYTGLCYLGKENPNHLEPLQDLWNEFDELQIWGLWFQKGYYGLASLYRDEKYGCIDEAEEESLLYQGIDEGETSCYHPLLNIKEKYKEFDEMKELLLEQAEEDPASALPRLTALHLRLKEYQEAYLAFRDLCVEMPLEVEHYYNPYHYNYVLQWMDCIQTIKEDKTVESLWFGAKEKEEVFALLHDYALGEDKNGACSKKISQCYRDGVCCEVDFEKSIYYLTQRVEREPLSGGNQALSDVQKELYHELGMLYYREDTPYVNVGKAKVYFELADCDFAHYFLFLIFKKEGNHEKGFFHAEKYVKQVGTTKYSPLTGECDLYMGECYEKGQGLRQNLNKAKALYEKAEEYGIKEAKKKLKRWE